MATKRPTDGEVAVAEPKPKVRRVSHAKRTLDDVDSAAAKKPKVSQPSQSARLMNVERISRRLVHGSASGGSSKALCGGYKFD